MNNNIKISIITVVYNSVQLIERTIKSIIHQSYSNLEYIIIDGGSYDGTVDVIKKYERNIQKWISEPDKGIYDAMNKGIHLANGDYILFINSGDELYNNEVLSKIFINNLNADVIYGDTSITDIHGNLIGKRRLRPPKRLSYKSFKKGMLVSHQSFIVKKTIAPNYNLDYKYSADYDWCIRILKNAKNVQNSNITISKFLQGGKTSETIYSGLFERFTIMLKHYGISNALTYTILILPRFIKYLFAKEKDIY